MGRGCAGVEGQLTGASSPLPGRGSANKHKPWIEAEYQGIVMENDNTVLLNPPLFALDKDAPLRYAGNWGWGDAKVGGTEKSGWAGRGQGGERGGPGRGEQRKWGRGLGKVVEVGLRMVAEYREPARRTRAGRG